MTQVDAVAEVMATGDWLTFEQLRKSIWYYYEIPVSEAGVSARIRDLRKARYGGHTIERRKTDRRGIYAYRLVKLNDHAIALPA
jgi:hypothetical protein